MAGAGTGARKEGRMASAATEQRRERERERELCALWSLTVSFPQTTAATENWTGMVKKAYTGFRECAPIVEWEQPAYALPFCQSRNYLFWPNSNNPGEALLCISVHHTSFFLEKGKFDICTANSAWMYRNDDFLLRERHCIVCVVTWGPIVKQKFWLEKRL